MREYIYGEIVSVNKKVLVLEVNNIGYKIEYVGDEEISVGDTVKMYLVISQSEFAQTYFGFLDLKTRDFFSKILKIKKIGFKKAARIINVCGYLNIASAILRKDLTFKIPFIEEQTRVALLSYKKAFDKSTIELTSSFKEIGFKTDENVKLLLKYDGSDYDLLFQEIYKKQTRT